MEEEKLIEVCDKCLKAACWYGEFLCDESREAGTVFKKISELKKLDLEDKSFWSDKKLIEVYGTATPKVK